MLRISAPELLTGDDLAAEIADQTGFRSVEVILEIGAEGQPSMLMVEGGHESETEPVTERRPVMETIPVIDPQDPEGKRQRLDENGELMFSEQHIYIDGEPQYEEIATGGVRPRRMGESDRAVIEVIVTAHDPLIVEVDAFEIVADGIDAATVTCRRRAATASAQITFTVNGQVVAVNTTGGVAELEITSAEARTIEVIVEDRTIIVEAV